jgi:hypothetical protein
MPDHVHMLISSLAPGKLVEYTTQVPPDLPKQHLLAALWREHDMVLALLCRVVHVIMILSHRDLLEGFAIPPGRFVALLPKLCNFLYSLRQGRRLSGRVSSRRSTLIKSRHGWGVLLSF